MYCNKLKYINRRKVWWKPGEVTHNPIKIDPMTWKILCQDNIQILPGAIVTIALSFGVEMSEGVTLVSLTQELIKKKCIIHNGIIIENTPDIIIMIQNNSTEVLDILPGQELCLLRYV